ncbi:hypothetical protein [Planctomicrobium sp. SH664]|uniref:hypothetical protein n=1 Tax=Planctomicrobium sp. SH664 TaxID=3448125 RepID=UPI003F5BAC44
MLKDVDFEGMSSLVDAAINEFWEQVTWLTRMGACDPSATEYVFDRESDCQLRIHAPENKQSLYRTVHEVLERIGLRSEVGGEEPLGQTPFTLEDLRTAFRWNWEFSTYAVLDDSGWYSVGEIGVEGGSSETVAEREEFAKSYLDRFIRPENPETTLVVVDGDFW